MSEEHGYGQLEQQTIQQKTAAILSTFPEDFSAEFKIVVGLVKLLIEEINKSDLASLKSTIAIQKAVTDGLVDDNKHL